LQEEIVGRFAFGATIAVALLISNSLALAQGLGGTLAGNVTQSNSNVTFPVEMELFGSIGSINYSSSNCGGKLSLLREDGGTFWYQENITYGADHCYNGGTIQISPSPFNDPTSWNWRWDGAGISVRGVLTGSVTTNP
jgi:hypothetical protein